MERFDQLPSLKELLIAHDLWAKKSLGQNFLLNPSITDRIATSAQVTGKNVLEVGPGPGGLTRSLLKKNPKHLIALEKDKRCIQLLQGLVEVALGKFTLLEKDALKIQLKEIYPKEKVTIAANLPYNIGTELLIGWLKDIDSIESMTLMFQKEVARRIVAKPDTKEYGRLSVIAQALCDTKILFDLPPTAFTPAPKVTSSVIRLVPKQNYQDYIPFIPALEKITAAAFGQRRKMLRSSLKGLFTEHILEGLNIDPERRAETLSVEEFLTLSKWIS